MRRLSSAWVSVAAFTSAIWTRLESEVWCQCHSLTPHLSSSIGKAYARCIQRGCLNVQGKRIQWGCLNGHYMESVYSGDVWTFRESVYSGNVWTFRESIYSGDVWTDTAWKAYTAGMCEHSGKAYTVGTSERTLHGKCVQSEQTLQGKSKQWGCLSGHNRVILIETTEEKKPPIKGKNLRRITKLCFVQQ